MEEEEVTIDYTTSVQHEGLHNLCVGPNRQHHPFRPGLVYQRFAKHPPLASPWVLL